MSLSVLKLALLGVVTFAVIGAVFTRKTFHVERVIHAAPEVVWGVLMDSHSYSAWNPVFIEIEGKYEPGAKVRNKVLAPSGKILEITALVRTVNRERELRQTGGIPGLLTFDHQWLLEPIEGGTIVTQHEVDRGIGLLFWDSSWIIPAYTQTIGALSERVKAQ